MCSGSIFGEERFASSISGNLVFKGYVKEESFVRGVE